MVAVVVYHYEHNVHGQRREGNIIHQYQCQVQDEMVASKDSETCSNYCSKSSTCIYFVEYIEVPSKDIDLSLIHWYCWLPIRTLVIGLFCHVMHTPIEDHEGIPHSLDLYVVKDKTSLSTTNAQLRNINL